MDQKIADLSNKLDNISAYAAANNAQLQTIRSFVQDINQRVIAIEEQLARIETRLNVVRRNQVNNED